MLKPITIAASPKALAFYQSAPSLSKILKSYADPVDIKTTKEFDTYNYKSWFLQGALLGAAAAGVRQYRIDKFAGFGRKAKIGVPIAGTLGVLHTGVLLFNALRKDSKNHDGIKINTSLSIGCNTAVALGATLFPLMVTAAVMPLLPVKLAARPVLSHIIFGASAGVFGALLGEAAYNWIAHIKNVRNERF